MYHASIPAALNLTNLLLLCGICKHSGQPSSAPARRGLVPIMLPKCPLGRRHAPLLLSHFSYSRMPVAGSRLVVVGIANALDLTQRFMPLLHRKGCAPTVVSFAAYTDKHLLDILRARVLAKAVKENDAGECESIFSYFPLCTCSMFHGATAMYKITRIHGAPRGKICQVACMH